MSLPNPYRYLIGEEYENIRNCAIPDYKMKNSLSIPVIWTGLLETLKLGKPSLRPFFCQTEENQSCKRFV